ncbi:hypothetical protein CEUSTIGMA_g3668.t1 [Chlamydomonas eustigma]|uniref:Leucine-rich repeat-containing protein 56 n=1 Tax=Chlamydomonas eustigma TaxID=1157962 RepID=A0A250WZE8_9CHLO|nr:hypothetical protein CEUSTIGMA_g3668.t1 [Chlamydomonas eustigma]|eukprot:GAX76224.1 hypothetical protein CEUSTIGMA_g3668.t1 [Chlamydomonas eustigma]
MALLLDNPTPVGGGRAVDATEQQWELMAFSRQDEDAYLRALTGVDSLDLARSLRIVANTSVTTVSHLGEKLQNLQELNLSGSVLETVRDLGTGFRALKVLWVSRCSLSGLEGLAAMPALRELYASYNDISDLQPLDSCSELEVLDLEGNCIDDMDGLELIHSVCPQIQSLTLAGNPISSSPDYHSNAARLIPSLKYLDDQNVSTPSSPTKTLTLKGSGRFAAPLSMSLSASGTLPACLSTGPDSELELVRDAIKHARVGVDSREFHELEMTLLTAAELPPEDAQPSTSMLPVSAGSWLRCSQQGSLPSLFRNQSLSSNTDSPPASSSSSTRLGSSSRGMGVERQMFVPSCSSSQRHLIRQRSSGIARPPSARPFSSRPGPSSNSAGGLYWKKNRLGSGGSLGSRTTATVDEDDEDAASALTFGVSGSAATLGGSLAKDLRRRKKASVWASTLISNQGALSNGAATAAAISVEAATASSPADIAGSSSRAEDIVADSGGLEALRVSFDTSRLMEELKKWKVTSADIALSTADDAASGSVTAWAELSSSSGAEDADFEQLPIGRLEPGSLAIPEESGSDHDLESVDLKSSDNRRLQRSPSAFDSLVKESSALTMTNSISSLPLRSHVAQLLVGSPAPASASPADGKRNAAPSAALSRQVPSRFPNDPMSPQQLIHTPKLSSAVFSPKAMPQATVGGAAGSLLGPNSRSSKMTLCKVLLEASGKCPASQLLSDGYPVDTHGSCNGHESLSIKSRPLLMEEYQRSSRRDNPLFSASDSVAEVDDVGLQRSDHQAIPAYYQHSLSQSRNSVAHTLETDLMSLNPQPVLRYHQLDDNSSDWDM